MNVIHRGGVGGEIRAVVSASLPAFGNLQVQFLGMALSFPNCKLLVRR